MVASRQVQLKPLPHPSASSPTHPVLTYLPQASEQTEAVDSEGSTVGGEEEDGEGEGEGGESAEPTSAYQAGTDAMDCEPTIAYNYMCEEEGMMQHTRM